MKNFLIARRSRNQIVIPAKAGIQENPPLMDWIPIFMGMTEWIGSLLKFQTQITKRCIIRLGTMLAGCLLLIACSQEDLRKTSQIYVTTEPAGASFFCDAVNCGITPATIAIEPGEHLLTVRKNGYRETRATLTTKEGEKAHLEIRLTPLKGLVLIHSEPSGADIDLGGVNIGKTPLLSHNFPFGEKRLQISMPGYISKSVNINVADRTPAKVDVQLVSDSAELFIESSPSDAQVFVDSADLGITPFSLPNVKTGQHTVELKLKGYEAFKQELSLQAGDKRKLSLTLKALPGKLTVLSKPSNARIYLNNQFKGETPLSVTNIPSGQYAIRAELTGYDPQLLTNEVIFGEENTVEFALVKCSGTLLITTIPPGASVYLDGELRGTTKTRNNELTSEQLQIEFVPKGQHQLQFTKKGYIDVQGAVNISPSQTRSIHQELKPRPVPFVPNTIIRTGDKPEQTFRGVIQEKYANGNIKMEIAPGIFKTFSKAEIISMEPIPVDGSKK